ncbi:MAG: HAMP domain-containing histidine kinase [Lachnospiraceae bacterium]|nr:HAMP domain-containing histidine kinase [Lachnospiraceae bacterium]
MKENNIRRRGGRWLRYVLTEVIFLVVAALFVLILWGHEKRASRKRDEELLRNIVEMFPAPMDDCQAARQYLQGIRLLWSDEAYKDRFTTSISIGDRQIADSLREINLLFYVENGKNRVWDLSEHFSKKQLEEVSRIADRLTGDKGFVVDTVYGRKTDGGEWIPTSVTVRSGATSVTLNVEDRSGETALYLSENLYDEAEKNVISDPAFFMIPQKTGPSSRIMQAKVTERDGFLCEGGELIDITGGTSVSVAGTFHEGSELNISVWFDRSGIVSAGIRKPLVITLIFMQAAAAYVMIIVWGTEQRRLEAKKLRDTFINAMAHQLKTPVAVVQNTSEYLMSGVSQEKQDHYCGVLVRESENMNYLLNRMLTYSRVMDRNVKLEKENVNLDGLVDEVLASHNEILLERGMSIDFSERNGGEVRCNPDLIRMVMDNLISNALKYGEEGTTVRIRTDGAAFSVYNRGTKFSDEELRNLWTPMYAEDRKGEAKTGGMGLAISAGILDRHGAAYHAENTTDGVRFCFDLNGTPVRNKEEKYVWLNIVTVVLDVLLSFFYGWQYLSSSSHTSRVPEGVQILLPVLWLLAGAMFLISFFSYQRFGKRRRR